MEETKKWYLSRTLWAGIISIALAGIEASQNGASWQAIAMAVLGTALLVIRPTTTKMLTK